MRSPQPRRRTLRTMSIVLALLSTMIAAGPASADNGFSSPLFGLATAPNGDLLVSDAGAGITSMRAGQIGGTISLPGVAAVAPLGRNSMWAVAGGPNPEENTGQALYRVSKGKVRLIADLFAVEESDPDGSGVDSNPFDVAALGGDAALVVDAGGNDLLRVTNQGHVDVLAIFPPELVSTANIQGLLGCPDALFLEFLCDVDAIPAQAVPTSVAVGPDGYYYVGELKGFPAPTKESNVWKVAPDANNVVCGSSPKCTKVDLDDDFTSIIDLEFGPDGRLHVVELDELSWAAIEIFGTGAGGTINACDLHTGACDEVASGIPILTAITFGKDGALWATQNALIPGLADVVKVN